MNILDVLDLTPNEHLELKTVSQHGKDEGYFSRFNFVFYKQEKFINICKGDGTRLAGQYDVLSISHGSALDNNYDFVSIDLPLSIAKQSYVPGLSGHYIAAKLNEKMGVRND